MNIAICDDNPTICADISNLIRRQIDDAEVFIFDTKDALLNAKADFDIFLLDIKAVDGIEIAKILRKRQEILNLPKSILIFVTGYDEFMSDAFDVHAFHYILKPIDIKKFIQIKYQRMLQMMHNL